MPIVYLHVRWNLAIHIHIHMYIYTLCKTKLESWVFIHNIFKRHEIHGGGYPRAHTYLFIYLLGTVPPPHPENNVYIYIYIYLYIFIYIYIYIHIYIYIWYTPTPPPPKDLYVFDLFAALLIHLILFLTHQHLMIISSMSAILKY